jgi:hypothetical protein
MSAPNAKCSSHVTNSHGADDERDAGEEEPVAPVIAVRVLEVLGEQGVVAAVGLPGDVEDVADVSTLTLPTRVQDSIDIE